MKEHWHCLIANPTKCNTTSTPIIVKQPTQHPLSLLVFPILYFNNDQRSFNQSWSSKFLHNHLYDHLDGFGYIIQPYNKQCCDNRENPPPKVISRSI